MYCHMLYSDYCDTAYNTYVEELPATGYNSTGKLIWHPSISDISPSDSSCVFKELRSNFLIYLSDVPFSSSTASASIDSDGSIQFSVTVDMSETGDVSGVCLFFCDLYLNAPFSGSYRCLASPAFTYSCTGTSDTQTGSSDYSEAEASFDLSIGESITVSAPKSAYLSLISCSGRCYFPYFEVVPDTALPTDTYNINTRPTSITGNYGIIGDNGQITKVEGNTIVNETDNSVYNPVTNTTSSITDWQYDYSTRTYTVTLDNGTTETITYGDENVTIVEGDTVYNVYYLADDSGANPEVPGACTHDYTGSVTTAATCEAPGLMTYTCGKCGNTYTAKIPAAGHTWTVKQTVVTEYDEQGSVTQQGYTIYKCSVCGTEYKSTDGTGPPGDLLPVEDEAGKLEQFFHTLVSFFTGLPAMFEELSAFLQAGFSYVPEEILYLISFGVSMAVLLGILKAIRR